MRTGPDDVTRARVIERDKGCAMCGAHTRDLQIQHRKPRKMGGRKGQKRKESNSLSNLVTLCADDHAWAESRRVEASEMGFLVRERDDPAQVPVAHIVHGLVFLNDDGTVSPVPHLEAS